MLRRQEEFSSKFGLLAAAVGSAVGLGNIWRFPSLVGKYGGGAFILVYLLVMVFLCLPLILAEFIIGRQARSDTIASFKKLSGDKSWYISGVVGVLASFLILSFYSIVAGWSLEYLGLGLANKFNQLNTIEAIKLFDSIKAGALSILGLLIILGLTVVIVIKGLNKGIESKAKTFLLIFILIMAILAYKGLSLDKNKESLKFLFKMDFSKINGDAILAALGHGFFSLNLGLGIMIIFGSYTPGGDKLLVSASLIVLLDMLISLLAGIAIFSLVFAYGIEPDMGPGLVFITLPSVLGNMDGGYFLGILFFLGLILVALTSTIALLENIVYYVQERYGLKRKKASLYVGLASFLLGLILILSNLEVLGLRLGGLNLFGLVEHFSVEILLPVAAFITAVFVGWDLDKDVVRNQLTNYGELGLEGFVAIFNFLMKYLVPLGIIAAFISSLFI